MIALDSRSTHHVHRGRESLPCYCAATRDHAIGKEQYAVVCNYCLQFAKLTTGAEVYPHRPDLHDKPLYACMPCGAWVGCHPDTTKPLGRIANAELRTAKMRAHTAFDPLWKRGSMKRKAAYQALAAQLGIPYARCHIGEFNEAMCARVLDAVQRIKAEARDEGKS